MLNEYRYYVIKESDLEKCDPQWRAVAKALSDQVLSVRGGNPVAGTFVDADWPDYEKFHQMFLEREGALTTPPLMSYQAVIEKATTGDGACVLRREEINLLVQHLMDHQEEIMELTREVRRLRKEAKAQTTAPDRYVEQNRQDLLDRSRVGMKKYGVNLERDDIALHGWLQHLREELLDAVNYAARAQGQIDDITGDGFSSRLLQLAEKCQGWTTADGVLKFSPAGWVEFCDRLKQQLIDVS